MKEWLGQEKIQTPFSLSDQPVFLCVFCVLSRLTSIFGLNPQKFSIMKDLTDARWIKLKGILFLVIGIVSSLLLILDQPTIKNAVLLALAVWAFCRFYYFAFYVIERYVDPTFRFSGLASLVSYLMKKK